MKITLTTMLMTLLPLTAFAQGQSSYRCTMGELTRRIEIMHETGVPVPCEVHYYKDNEAPGERQVLWRALNEAGYCESKTNEFIAGLTEMGWNCTVPAATSEPAEVDDSESPEMKDDTDTLAPAGDTEVPGPGNE